MYLFKVVEDNSSNSFFLKFDMKKKKELTLQTPISIVSIKG